VVLQINSWRVCGTKGVVLPFSHRHNAQMESIYYNFTSDTELFLLIFTPTCFTNGMITYEPHRQQRSKCAQAHNCTPYRRQQSFMLGLFKSII
jgi:hypothetical protein